MNSETERLFDHYGDILRARGLAERSITNYQYSLKGFVGFLGARCLSGATSADITAYQIQALRGIEWVKSRAWCVLNEAGVGHPGVGAASD